MHAANHHIITKKALAVAAAIGLALLLVVNVFIGAANASRVIGVSSNVAAAAEDDDVNLVLVVRAQNDGDVHELEIDHSFEDTLPEFSVYADEANPYGGQTCGPASNLDCQTELENAGASVVYSAAESQWTIDFGPEITDFIRANGGEVDFYFVLRDADRNELWGTMYDITPDNTFNFDLIEGTGDELIPEEVVEEEDVVIPGVPNTSVVL